MTSGSRFRAVPALAVLALAGCGGGGGGEPPRVVVPDGPRVVAAAPDSDVSAANVAALGAPLVRAVLGGTGGGLLDPLGGAAGSPLAASAAALALVQAPTLTGRTALVWIRRVDTQARKRIAAVTTEVLDCSFGGQITVSFDDADNDKALSAGDSISFVARDCVEDVGLPAANGGFTMRINAVELDAQGEPTAIDMSGSFDAFTLEGFGTIDGAFRLWAREETAASTRLRVRYLNAGVTEAGGAVRYDFDVDGLDNAAGGSFEISGGLGLGGRTYALSTPVRLQYAAGEPPALGRVDLRDAAGDALQLVARSATSFDLGLLPAGATAWTVSLTGLRWDDYAD